MQNLTISGTFCMFCSCSVLVLICSILADQFKLEDHDETSSSSILLDLYYYTVQFALDNGFNKEQLSAFFSILKKTHEVCNGESFLLIKGCTNPGLWLDPPILAISIDNILTQPASISHANSFHGHTTCYLSRSIQGCDVCNICFLYWLNSSDVITQSILLAPFWESDSSCINCAF